MSHSMDQTGPTGDAACGKCGASVLMVKTPKNRPVMLDPDPAPEGTVVIADGYAYVFRSPDSISLRLAGLPRRRLHLAACPKATVSERRASYLLGR